MKLCFKYEIVSSCKSALSFNTNNCNDHLVLFGLASFDWLESRSLCESCLRHTMETTGRVDDSKQCFSIWITLTNNRHFYNNVNDIFNHNNCTERSKNIVWRMVCREAFVTLHETAVVFHCVWYLGERQISLGSRSWRSVIKGDCFLRVEQNLYLDCCLCWIYIKIIVWWCISCDSMCWQEKTLLDGRNHASFEYDSKRLLRWSRWELFCA